MTEQDKELCEFKTHGISWMKVVSPLSYAITITSSTQLEQLMHDNLDWFHGFTLLINCAPNSIVAEAIEFKVRWEKGKLWYCDKMSIDLASNDNMIKLVRFLKVWLKKRLKASQDNKPHFDLSTIVKIYNPHCLFNTKEIHIEHTPRGHVKLDDSGYWLEHIWIIVPEFKVGNIERHFGELLVDVRYDAYGDNLTITTPDNRVKELESLGVFLKFSGAVTTK